MIPDRRWPLYLSSTLQLERDLSPFACGEVSSCGQALRGPAPPDGAAGNAS